MLFSIGAVGGRSAKQGNGYRSKLPPIRLFAMQIIIKVLL